MLTDAQCSTIPIPKYAIGQPVWHASTNKEAQPLECPDCKGTRKWEAKTPAGETFEFRCPRCSSYYHHPPMALRWVPSTRKLTVGSVRIDTASDRPIEYMCAETGIGSGYIYDERDLFPTEEQATYAAKAKAAVNNSQTPERDAFNKAEEAARQTFTSAIVKAAEDGVQQARWRLRDVQSWAFDESLSDSDVRANIKEALAEVD